MKILETKAVVVIAGALVTLILWAIAFVVLNGVYNGNFPWLLSALIALLYPLIGGFDVTQLEPAKRARFGGLSGFGAGLIVILLGVLMVLVGTFGGGAGALLTRREQKAAQR